jgi:hypothetical protein
MMVSSKKDTKATEAPQAARQAPTQRPTEANVVALKGLMVPLVTYEAISDYVYLGRQPDPFLHAVLSNDLLGACKRANRLDAVYLRDTVLFVYNHCPTLCAGSAERVDQWIARCMDHFRRCNG